MGDRGEPQILSMKMKTFDADCVKNELVNDRDKPMDEDRDSPDSSEKHQSRFSGKFHRRSIRRGSKYKMTHRSPTELSKVKKIRRAKANDRERMRMQTLNQALEKLRVILPAFPDETKLTKIETLRFANNYIKTLTEMIKSLDSGNPPNIPLTGWEGMLAHSGQDSLQQCAILAHSLMSQQFGGVGRGDEAENLGDAWGPLSPMSHAHMTHEHMSHVVSPVRGQQYPHPAHHGYHDHVPHDHAQLSPGHENMSPVMTPVKMPPSPAHPISPDHYHVSSPHVSSTQHVASPPKKEAFIDNNPGFYRGHSAAPGHVSAPQWAPDLAPTLNVPSYDDMTHPPIASSLYGQDLRYNQYY